MSISAFDHAFEQIRLSWQQLESKAITRRDCDEGKQQGIHYLDDRKKKKPESEEVVLVHDVHGQSN